MNSSPPTLRTAVFGAHGRMGSQTCRAVEAADDLELVARITSTDPPQAAVDAGAQVVVDFTSPDAVMGNLRWCVEHGIHAVVGTSGVDEQRVAELRRMVSERNDDVGILVVPNFSIGAVLLMRFAAQAAPYFESVEVIEMHHPDKLDAPSGAATRTAEMIAAARQEAQLPPVPDATTSDPAGARGAQVEGIHVHALRARGMMAHQEVLLGDVGQTLTLRHDSVDRESFMPGVLAAVRDVASTPGVRVGLDSVLGLD